MSLQGKTLKTATNLSPKMMLLSSMLSTPFALEVIVCFMKKNFFIFTWLVIEKTSYVLQSSPKDLQLDHTLLCLSISWNSWGSYGWNLSAFCVSCHKTCSAQDPCCRGEICHLSWCHWAETILHIQCWILNFCNLLFLFLLKWQWVSI